MEYFYRLEYFLLLCKITDYQIFWQSYNGENTPKY